MSLQDWRKNGWLLDSRPSRQEVAALLAVADRDLRDCRAAGLSADLKLNIGYNAALHAALTALTAAGYKIQKGESHHFRAIHSLAFTIGAKSELVSRFDGFRRKRNIGSYEMAGAVSDQEAREMLDLAVHLRAEVEKWLKAEHSDLV